MGGWLLQRLEEAIGRFFCEPLGSIDQRHLHSPAKGPQGDAADERADLFDLDLIRCASREERMHIGMRVSRDLTTRGTRIARPRGVVERKTVDRLGHLQRKAALADPIRTGQQVRTGHRSGDEVTPEELCRTGLPEDVVPRHQTVTRDW